MLYLAVLLNESENEDFIRRYFISWNYRLRSSIVLCTVMKTQIEYQHGNSRTSNELIKILWFYWIWFYQLANEWKWKWWTKYDRSSWHTISVHSKLFWYDISYDMKINTSHAITDKFFRIKIRQQILRRNINVALLAWIFFLVSPISLFPDFTENGSQWFFYSCCLFCNHGILVFLLCLCILFSEQFLPRVQNGFVQWWKWIKNRMFTLQHPYFT